MLNVSQSGARGKNFVDRASAETRIRAFEAEFFDLIESNATVAEMFAAARAALTGATMTVRMADPSSEKGWAYREIPDHAVRLAAFEKLATVLRLKPTGGASVQVNTSNQTINVSAGERLSELDAIGVPREMVEAACLDLLAASKGGQTSVSVPASESQKTEKGGPASMT